MFILAFAFTVASNLLFASAQAQEFSGPIKVLGRGILNSQTKEILQLACVGEPTAGNPESNCDQLQFVYISPVGKFSWVGERFSLKALTGDLQQLSKRGLLKELKEKIVSLKTENLTSSDSGLADELFPYTIKVNGQGESRNLKYTYPIFFTAIGIVNGVILGVSGFNPATSWIVVVSAIAILAWTAPFILDLLSLPARMISKQMLSNAMIGSGTSPSVLTEKNISFWQERAQSVKAKAFRSLFISISDSDAIIENSVSDACRIDVQLEKGPNWHSTVSSWHMELDEWTKKKDDWRWSGTFKMSASEAFVRKFSKTVTNAALPEPSFFPPYPGENEKKQESADQLFLTIMKQQVRKNAYLVDEKHPANYVAFIRPDLKKAINYNSNSYCVEVEVNTVNSQLIKKLKYCDRSPVLIVAKIAQHFPKCSKLKSASGAF